MIRFRLLGEIDLRSAGGAQVDQLLRQPKRLALLAYLVTPAPGAWHRRDILVAQFWPELDAARARTSLRNALYGLRQTLGEEVLRTRGDEEVSVDPVLVTTDLAELGVRLRAGDTEGVLELYGGELLPGLFPPDSEGFERWLEGERARLRVQVAGAGMEWAASLEAAGRLEEALAAVRRVVQIHPDDETSVRRLMALHDAIGDRIGGLNAYEGYRRRLASEFDAAPAAETVALADRMRRSTGPRAGPAIAERPAQRPPDAAVASAPAGPRPKRWLPMGAVIATLSLLALLVWGAARAPAPRAVGASLPLTSEEGLQIEPSISPNGRLVAYARGTSRRMRILVQKIAGGAPWALTDDSASFELFPRWSPDNDALLFLSRNSAYLASMTGGSTRLVAAGGEGDASVRSASWSPNGDSVVIVRNDSLLVQPLEGIGARLVGTGFQLHSCVWAERRPWIACVSGNWIAHVPGTLFGNQAPTTIVLYPAVGGAPIPLTGSDKEHESPAWSADGRFLWVLANQDGVSGDAYAIPVGRDGHASGPSVRMGLNAESISLSAERMAYSVPARKANIWSVPIPSRAPVTLAAATPVTAGNQVIEVPHVSRDGRWLVYDSNLRGNADIYRIPVGGGVTTRLTDDPRPEYGAALSPDGREVAYHIWVGGERHLVVKDLTDAIVHEVMSDPGDWGVPRWSPGGSALATWSHQREEGAIAVIRRDGDGRWQPPSWMMSNAQLPVWSPDGRRIAFVQLRGSIGMIPVDSGATGIVYAPRPGSEDPVATYLAWGRDPDALWFLGHNPAGRSGIWRLDLHGGAPHLLVDFGDGSDRASGPALATDGVRFFFTLDERLSNIRWAALVAR